jgi:hypothetical protein
MEPFMIEYFKNYTLCIYLLIAIITWMQVLFLTIDTLKKSNLLLWPFILVGMVILMVISTILWPLVLSKTMVNIIQRNHLNDKIEA